MIQGDSAALEIGEKSPSPRHLGILIPEDAATGDEVLATALDLLERNHAVEADRLLTAAVLSFPKDDRLWLAAGICRMRRGAVRAARSAFAMSAWLSGDPDARELSDLCKR